MLITAGATQALDLLCTRVAPRGGVVLVEELSYPFAVALFRDRGLGTVPVEIDDDGLVPERLRDVISRLAPGRSAFLYCIPTLHNPTTRTMPLERRLELLSVAGSLGLTVVEDDTYRELHPPFAPPSLWSLAGGEGVIRVGSFSKVLGPGLRVGWMTGPRTLMRRLSEDALFSGGGGIAHFAACVVGELMCSHEFAQHVVDLRQALTDRSNALLEGLGVAGPASGAGGLFHWWPMPEGQESEALRATAAQAGVGVLESRAGDATARWSGRRACR
jgi:DNA-binding transcriptional MocR family regulator